ncbi:hypothetical protein GCM10020360_14760 [Nonlabens tegetincola]
MLAGTFTVAVPFAGSAPAEAVFAEEGEGKFRSSIDWFSFGEEGPIVPAADGTVTYSNDRQIGQHTLRTTCTIGNIFEHNGAPGRSPLSTYRSGYYQGDGLSYLYNIGGAGWDNQLVNGITNTTSGSTVQFRILCGAELIDATKATSTPIQLQGLVVADAESSNQTTQEYISAAPITNTEMAGEAVPALDATWRVIDRYRAPNCDTNIYASVDQTTNGLRFAPYGDECIGKANPSVGRGPGPMAVGFMEGATSADVTLKGGGGSAIAIGMVVDTDFGDAPASYGEAGALFSPTWAGGEIPQGGGEYVSGPEFELGDHGEPAQLLGSHVDAEVTYQASWDALLDDESPDLAESDEDALDAAQLPTLDYTPGAETQITLACTVATGTQGFVAGWIDWAHDGNFLDSDRSDTVECENGQATLTWTAPADAVAPAEGEQTFLRLRIAADPAELLPVGMSSTGEVEDYALDAPLVTAVKTSEPVQGTVIHRGETVTYTLTFANDSKVTGPILYSDDLADVLDSATLEAGPTVTGPTGVTATFVGTQINVTGDLAQGESATVTYTVRVNDDASHGERLTNHLLLSDGNGRIVEESLPVCLPEHPRCTDHPIAVPELEVVKIANPPSGESVSAGQRITYEVLFNNWGAAPAPIDWFDDLTGVLDDATWGDSLQLRGDLTATFDEATKRIAVTGSLEPGGYAVMRYTVIVKADGERGDGHLANFMVESDDPTPAECVPATKLCTEHEAISSNITSAKSADPATGSTVVAGQEVTYTLSFVNDGAAGGEVDHVDDLTKVLDDADFVADSIVAPAGWAVTGPTDNALAIAGPLAAGESAQVSYTVRVKPDGERGDEQLANFLFEEGTDPPTTCETGNENCTTHPVGKPALVVTKTSDPGSGTAVVSGQSLTYTLTFDNSKGGAEAPVAHTDDLSGVLDDAELTAGPTVTPAGVLTGAIQDGRLAISGEVPAGTKATVSYAVKVKADGEREDNTLANFLLAGDDDPPPTCEPGSELCTTHPAPGLVVTKTADPESTEPVIAGQQLSYTLTFDNTTGSAPAPVDHIDDLSAVLDDATFVEGSLLAGSGLTAKGPSSDAQLAIGGSVPAGEKRTVSYAVTVNADGERGDDVLANYVFGAGDTPPTECLLADETCTTHPALSANVAVVKSAMPGSGAEVVAGQAVDYTLTFTNTGEAPGRVDFTDDLFDVLDDAGLTVQPHASDAALTPALAGTDLRVTGMLAPGQTVTVSYQVTVNADGERGNDLLGNVVVVTGEDPPTVCEPGDDACTEHPVVQPEIDVQKSSTPDSGTVLLAGDSVSYTLTFRNEGTGAGDVNFTDVLDSGSEHATLQGDVVVSDPALSATFDGGGDHPAIAVTGTLAPGAEVTVTYTYRLNADLPHGARLTNYLLDEGESVPGLCLPENPRCTDHPAVMPGLDTAKSSTPDSTTPVAAGDEITYTLTFASWGPADSFVEYADSLTDVLDDADLIAGPTADSPALKATLRGDSIAVLGTVPSGETVTVSYTVRVKPDAERLEVGNNSLANYLVADGEAPPTECLPENWNCTVHPAPNVQVQKSSDPASGEAVTEGQELSYTLRFENSGTAPGAVDYRDSLADVLDDADFVAGSLVATGGLTATGPAKGELTVTGTLAPGAVGEVTYRVVVKPDSERESSGNSTLANFVFADGEDPPTVCEPGDNSCTTHPTPDLVVAKSVSPASGTSVVAGDELRYTLTFENRGTAEGAVAYEDLLAGVLDDAALVGDPVVTGDGLLAELDGDVLRVSGALPPGARVDVSYTVRVLAEGERGDDLLANFVVRPGDDPPPVCDPETSICTVNPVGEIVATKSVDPASGTEVLPGDTLRYTLTFENVGKGAAQVAHLDDLTDVLDDASLTGTPVTTGGLTVTGPEQQQLLIGGALAAGASATVTYEVTVLPAAQAGNRVLANFVFGEGTTPPTTCEPGDAACTENPVTPPVPPVPPKPPVPPIGETGGGSQLPWLIGGGAVVLAGAGLLLWRRFAAGRAE